MKQTHGEKTREKILDAGVQIWPEISITKLAQICDLTHPAVLYHFPDIKELRNSIASHAVKLGNSRVIVQLIAGKHKAVQFMSVAERKRHFNSV